MKLLPTVVLVLSLLYANRLFAQENNEHNIPANSLKLSAGWFYTKSVRHTSRNQFNINYERKIYHNWSISIAYAQWISFRRNSNYLKNVVLDQPAIYDWQEGALYSRVNYKMVDALGVFKCKVSRKHFLNFGGGVSYCRGENTYIQWFAINPEPPYDAVLYFNYKKEGYWGITSSISYEYFTLGDRLSIGAGIKGRCYLKNFPWQLDANVIAGIHF